MKESLEIYDNENHKHCQNKNKKMACANNRFKAWYNLEVLYNRYTK